MFQPHIRSLIAIAAFATLASSVAQAVPLYGADGNLYEIDVTTGGHVVVDSGDSAYRLGLAYNGLTGTMYSIGLFDGVVSTVDLTNGNTAPVGPSNGFPMTGLTFSSDYSRLFSLNSDNGALLSIDPLTGAGVVVGGGGSNMLDLSTRSDGTVFGGGFGGISTFDTNTGAATFIGGGIHVWTAIAFDENDVLYGIDLDTDALFQINTTTGAATLVGGDIGVDVRGMAFVTDRNGNPVPDAASSSLLLAMSLIALAAVARRRRTAA